MLSPHPRRPSSQRIKLAPEQAIFLFVSDKGILPASVATLQTASATPRARAPPGARYLQRLRKTRAAAAVRPAHLVSPSPQVYDQYADEDGFLYMKYSGENAFGCECL